MPQFISRQSDLVKKIKQAGLDALAVNPGPTLVYLTGLHFHLSERPVVALFKPDGQIFLVLPELEAAKTVNLSFPIEAVTYPEDLTKWQSAFTKAMTEAKIGAGRIGVEPTRLRFIELKFLEQAAGNVKMVSAEEILAELRMQKDTEEVAHMRKAVDIAQRALQETLTLVKTGMSERELASELNLQLLRLGSDSELPFTPIVSSGPNSANPHATPTNRLLTPGDLLVIDWGAAYEGYYSDLTRTFAIGDVEPELTYIAEVVKQANTAGRAAARPGARAKEVDLAARNVINAAGYGEYFFHRTGHGLGMEGHEPPYIREDNPLVLQPGMTFTIEPGIYLTGRNGVRIEDDVVITENGAETLSDLPRDLIVLR